MPTCLPGGLDFWRKDLPWSFGGLEPAAWRWVRQDRPACTFHGLRAACALSSCNLAALAFPCALCLPHLYALCHSTLLCPPPQLPPGTAALAIPTTLHNILELLEYALEDWWVEFGNTCCACTLHACWRNNLGMGGGAQPCCMPACPLPHPPFIPPSLPWSRTCLLYPC